MFFVESLAASFIGLEMLARIVTMVQDLGHEVQLHLHTEWLNWKNRHLFLADRGRFLRSFSIDEQTDLIGRAVENLQKCGAREVTAVRAGNYGADNNTFLALAKNGLLYDTSYNLPYLGTQCRLLFDSILTQPVRVSDLYEFPITFFQDLPARYRPVQLSACQNAEMELTLLQAASRRWYSYVLVSHSSELLWRTKQPGYLPLPDRIMISRFENLCRFLAVNRDTYRTIGFSEIVNDSIPGINDSNPLISPISNTILRYGEQAWHRFLGRVLS